MLLWIKKKICCEEKEKENSCEERGVRKTAYICIETSEKQPTSFKFSRFLAFSQPG